MGIHTNEMAYASNLERGVSILYNPTAVRTDV
jgi:hypothetical protein